MKLLGVIMVVLVVAIIGFGVLASVGVLSFTFDEMLSWIVVIAIPFAQIIGVVVLVFYAIDQHIIRRQDKDTFDAEYRPDVIVYPYPMESVEYCWTLVIENCGRHSARNVQFDFLGKSFFNEERPSIISGSKLPIFRNGICVLAPFSKIKTVFGIIQKEYPKSVVVEICYENAYGKKFVNKQKLSFNAWEGGGFHIVN